MYRIQHPDKAGPSLPLEKEIAPDKREGEPIEAPTKNKPLEKVTVNDDHSDQPITIGGNLSTRCQAKLIKVLRKHADAFTWVPADMTGIPHFVAKHELKAYPYIEPRVQRKRSIALDRRKVVKEVIEEWLKSRIVKKVRYPTWVANLVLVKKAYGSWRMCIDFKDSKKASLRTYDEKMAFHTDEGVFCNTKMPFGLKNRGATNQRLVDTIFEGQIGRNFEAYIDDMVIKSKTEQDLLKDIKETLLTLKKVNLKLNPKKCSFGMEKGKFLGYIVASEGIRANPEKAKAATERVISCLDTLKKCTNKKDFRWTEAAVEAFQIMKKLIAELPMLTAPIKDEELMVCLSTASEVMAATAQNTNNTTIRSIPLAEKHTSTAILGLFLVAYLMLSSMSPDLQRILEKYNAYDMLNELKTMFEELAKQELFETVKAFHSCKQMGKTLAALHAIMKLHEKGEKGKGKGKNKLAYDPKPKIPPPPKREHPEKDSICHHCKEVGHWRRNCPSYHAELKKRKNASVASTSGLRESRKLKHGALSMYMGNGIRTTVEAIRSFDLV
ncbi:reverse transcriptase domain-containing protein, partial [Tanacetum coccineum]